MPPGRSSIRANPPQGKSSGDRLLTDLFLASEIRDGQGNLDHPIPTPTAETQAPMPLGQQPSCGISEVGVLAELFRSELRVGYGSLSIPLPAYGSLHPAPHLRRRLARLGTQTLRRRNIDPHRCIHSICQCTAQLGAILGYRDGVTATFAGVLTSSTGTRIRCGNQEESTRELEGAVGSGYADITVLEWLAEGLERIAPELTQLVQKKDTTVSAGDLARTWRRAAPEKCRWRDAVVRCPERASRWKLEPVSTSAGDPGYFEFLVHVQRWKDRWQAAGR